MKFGASIEVLTGPSRDDTVYVSHSSQTVQRSNENEVRSSTTHTNEGEVNIKTVHRNNEVKVKTVHTNKGEVKDITVHTNDMTRDDLIDLLCHEKLDDDRTKLIQFYENKRNKPLPSGFKNRFKQKERTICSKEKERLKMEKTSMAMHFMPHMWSPSSLLPSMPSIKVAIDEESKSWFKNMLDEFLASMKQGFKVDVTHGFKSLFPDMFTDLVSKFQGLELFSSVVFLFKAMKKIFTDSIPDFTTVKNTIQSVLEMLILGIKTFDVGETFAYLVELITKYASSIVSTLCLWFIPAPMYEEHTFTESSFFLAVVGLVTFVYNGYDTSLNGAVKIVRNILLLDGKKNVEATFNGFLECVTSVFSYIGSITGIKALEQVGFSPPEFTQELQKFEIKHFAIMSKEIGSDDDLSWTNEDVKELEDLCSRITTRIFESKLAHPKHAALVKMRDSFNKILTVALERVHAVGKPRSEPIGLVLVGGAGLGKTTVCQRISAAVCAKVLTGENLANFRNNTATQIFVPVSGSKYHDHYNAQLTTVVDDVLQAKETPGGENNDSINIISWINTTPVLLNAAELRNKSKLNFVSDFVFATSNVKVLKANNVNGITCPEAFIRRFPYCYELDTDKKITYVEFRTENKHLSEKQAMNQFFKFRQIDWSTGKALSTPELKFSDVVKVLVENHKFRKDFHQKYTVEGIRDLVDEFSGFEEHMFKTLVPELKSRLGLLSRHMENIMPLTLTSAIEANKHGLEPKVFTMFAPGDFLQFSKLDDHIKKMDKNAWTYVYDYVCEHYSEWLKADSPNLKHVSPLLVSYDNFVLYLSYMLFIAATDVNCCNALAVAVLCDSFGATTDSRVLNDEVERAFHAVRYFITSFANVYAANVPGYKLSFEALSTVCKHKNLVKPTFVFSSNIVRGWLPDYIWASYFDVSEKTLISVSICSKLDSNSIQKHLYAGLLLNPTSFIRIVCKDAVETYSEGPNSLSGIIKSFFSSDMAKKIAFGIGGIIGLMSAFNFVKGRILPISNVNPNFEQSGRMTKVTKNTPKPIPLPPRHDIGSTEEHSGNMSAAYGLSNKVLGNMICFSTDKKSSTGGIILLLKGDMGVGLGHYAGTFEAMKEAGATLWGRRGSDDPKSDSSYFPIDLDCLLEYWYTPCNGVQYDISFFKVKALRNLGGVEYKRVIGKDLTTYMITFKEFSNVMSTSSGAPRQLETMLVKPKRIDINMKNLSVSSSLHTSTVAGVISYGSFSEYKVANALMGKYDCARGDCGSPVICINTSLKKQVCLMSIHCSGNTSSGVGISAPFYIEDFVHYMEVVGDHPPIVEEQMNTTLLEAHGATYAPGWTPRDMSFVKEHYANLGFDVKSPYTKEGTNLVKNVLWEQCSGGQNSGTAPAVTKRSVGFDPIYNAHLKYGSGHKLLDPDFVDYVADKLDRIIISPKYTCRISKVLTIEEALVGVFDDSGTAKIIPSMMASTSPGFPYTNHCQNKTNIVKDGCIVEGPDLERHKAAVNSLLDKCKKGLELPVVSLDNLKDEVRPVVDGKVKNARLISCASFDMTTLVKMYFGSFIDYLNTNRIRNGSAVGINPYVEFNDVYRAFKGRKVADGDFSSFDGNLPVVLYKKFANCANKFYSTYDHAWKPEDDIVRSHLVLNISSGLHMFGYGNDKTVALVENHQPSGVYTTANANTYMGSLIGLMNLSKLWLEGQSKINLDVGESYLDVFHKIYHLPDELFTAPFLQYGDDHVFAIPEVISWVVPSIYSESMNELGFKHTSAQKGECTDKPMVITDCSFLKREFVEFHGRFVGRLEYNSILKMIEYSVPGKQTHVEEMQVVDTMLLECAPHGYEVFKSLTLKLQRYCSLKDIDTGYLAVGAQDENIAFAHRKASHAYLHCEDFYAQM